ncbi:deoxynucleotide monophosphate kinase family protein [Paralcaligenes ginsengisoli]
MRAEIVQAFGIDPGLFHVSTKEQKTPDLAIGRCNDGVFMQIMVKLGVSVTAPRSPREIMRWWGTEYRRAKHPTYWLDKANESIDAAARRGFRRIVITDVRFANEADFVRGLGGQVWMIKRTLAEMAAATHESETQLALIHPDAEIKNNRSMVSFANEVLRTYEAQYEAA